MTANFISIDGYKINVADGGISEIYDKDVPIEQSYYNYSGNKTTGFRTTYNVKILCHSEEELQTCLTLFNHKVDSLTFVRSTSSQLGVYNNDVNWSNFLSVSLDLPSALRVGYLTTHTGNLTYNFRKSVDYLAISYWIRESGSVANIQNWDFRYEDSNGFQLENGMESSFSTMIDKSGDMVTGISFIHSSNRRYMDVRFFYGYVDIGYIVSLMQNSIDNPKEISTYPYVYLSGTNIRRGNFAPNVLSVRPLKKIEDNILYELNVDFVGVDVTWDMLTTIEVHTQK